MTKCRLVCFAVLAVVAGCSMSDSASDDVLTGSDTIEQTDGQIIQDVVYCESFAPYCDGETAVTCVEGIEIRQECNDGAYCNRGECVQTSILFPDDAGFHLERSEWWYYTGHVNTGDGASYGFEVTIFQYDYSVFFGTEGYGYMCHVAVLDETAGEHYHNDTIRLEPQVWTSAPIVMEVDNCHFELGGDGNDHIVGTIPTDKDGKSAPWTLDIVTTAQKRPAIHGGDGIIPMSDEGGTSWYYSYTRLGAEGTLTIPDGSELQVTGQAWMDHQWGAFDVVDFKGWDWWSMQFEDGREIMLFQFTDWDGNLAFQAGTLIEPDGSQTELEGFEDFTITPQRKWTSTHTDGIYPLDWDITIPVDDWSLKVTTKVDDQEMHNIAQNYWEGATSITGTRNGENVQGVGYTELTGYATDFMDPER